MFAGREGTLNGISPCMYMSFIFPIPFIWKEFCPDVFRPVPAKRDPGSKRDNCYYINTPFRFAGTILF